jgi:diguanylate cyclase (GGDEF)-like protein
VLEVVAERLINNVRVEDTAARLGGDEFVVVLEDIMNISDATDFAHKLIQEISQPIILDKNIMSVTASIGIALSSKVGVNSKILIGCADNALYQAKSAGKNKFICV